MTIKEVEKRTGLARSNIRFYEKEKLISPLRNDGNGYRDYSEKDVEDIGKIAYLRTLEISVEDIRAAMAGQASLMEILEKQNAALQGRIEELNQAKALCRRMLEAGDVSFDELQVEDYVADSRRYWSENRAVFRLDTVGFLSVWGSFVVWTAIASLCLVVGVAMYPQLPPQIPVQWSKGIATSLVDKAFIFAYPLACVLIRVLLRPFLYARLAAHRTYGEIIAEYLTNSLCFVVLSVEVFSILFTCGVVKSVATVLIVDTVVLAGIWASGMSRIGFLREFHIDDPVKGERR